jgi:hypothetical protein
MVSLWGCIEKESYPERVGQFQLNLVHMILGFREFKIFQIKGHFFINGKIMPKIQKWSGVI